MAKKESLTQKKIEDLKKDLQEKREAIRKFRFGFSGSAKRNTKEGYANKKAVARILTELRRRELAE